MAHLPAHVLVLVLRSGVPRKVVAQLMGHASIDASLNVYTHLLDGSMRAAAEKVSEGLFTKTA